MKGWNQLFLLFPTNYRNKSWFTADNIPLCWSKVFLLGLHADVDLSCMMSNEWIRIFNRDFNRLHLIIAHGAKIRKRAKANTLKQKAWRLKKPNFFVFWFLYLTSYYCVPNQFWNAIGDFMWIVISAKHYDSNLPVSKSYH